MRLDAPPPLPHSVRYEREVTDIPPSGGWRERVATPRASASCICGELDTGYVDADQAYRAAQEHVKQELPGVDWGADLTPRPASSEGKTA